MTRGHGRIAQLGQLELHLRLLGQLLLELAELALAEGAEPPGLWSGGAFFPLEPGR